MKEVDLEGEIVVISLVVIITAIITMFKSFTIEYHKQNILQHHNLYSWVMDTLSNFHNYLQFIALILHSFHSYLLQVIAFRYLLISCFCCKAPTHLILPL